MPGLTEESAELALEELKDGAIQLVLGIYSDDMDGKSAADILIVALQRLDGIYALMGRRTSGII